VIKNCPVCNTEFETDSKQRMYCRPACKTKAHKMKVGKTFEPYNCEYCGSEFQREIRTSLTVKGLPMSKHQLRLLGFF